MTVFFLLLLIIEAETNSVMRDSLQLLYESGNYLAVIERARDRLKDTLLTSEDKMGIHLILAFSYVALDKVELAKLEFLEALAIKPDLELDPQFVSPKILRVFNDAKRLLRLPHRESVIYPKRKINPMLITLPGLYDIKYKNKSVGYTFLGTFISSALFSCYAIYQYNKAHREYQNFEVERVTRDRGTLDKLYNKYKLWYNISIISISVTVSIPFIYVVRVATF